MGILFNRRKLRAILAFFGLSLFLSISFNNCTSNEYAVGVQGSDSPNSLSGNSTGYGGKISSYRRYLPGYMCEQTASSLSTIEIQDGIIRFVESTANECIHSTTPLIEKDIDTSPLQNEVISYKDGVYMNVPPTLNGIPDKLSEAWCRDELNPQFDIITYYDRSAQKGFGKIYFKDASSALIAIPEFSVSRVISQRIINYQALNFSLRIDRDSLAKVPGTFLGELHFSHLGQVYQKSLFCRLGGDLDPKIWPALQVNRTRVIHSAYHASTDSIIYSSATSGFGAGLFSWNGGKTETLIAPAKGEIGIMDFQLMGSTNLVFRSYANNFFNQISSINLQTRQIKPINKPQYQFSRGVNFHFQYSVDPSSNFLLYLDDSARAAIFGENDLYISNLSEPSKQLSVPLIDTLGPSVVSFSFNKQNSKIAYIFSDTNIHDELKIGLVNTDGSNTKIIVPKALGLPKISQFVDFVGNDNLLLVRAASDTYTLSINDNSIHRIFTQTGASQGVHISQPNGKFLKYGPDVIADRAFNEYFVRRLDNWSEIALGSLDYKANAEFDFDEVNETGTTIINNELVLINLRTGTRTIQCPNSFGEKVIDRFSDTSSNTSFIAKSKALGAEFLLSIYEIQGTNCLLRNSIPSSKGYANILQVAPNKYSLLMIAQLPGKSYLSPVHVPLDGKPALQINSPTITNASIVSAYYINGGRTVIFTGDQLNQSVSDIFSVDIPDLTK